MLIELFDSAGLDAPTRELVVSLLQHLHESSDPPHIILGMRLQDPIPTWTTHLALIHKTGSVETGRKQDVLSANASVFGHHWLPTSEKQRPGLKSNTDSEVLVDLDNVSVTYGERKVTYFTSILVHGATGLRL